MHLRKSFAFLLILLHGVSFSQEPSKFTYCEIVGTQKFLSQKVIVQIDYGQEMKFFSRNNFMLDPLTGKPISFNSMVDALNYMGQDGWEFVQAYAVTVGNSNVYHWLLKKPENNDEFYIEENIRGCDQLTKSLKNYVSGRNVKSSNGLLKLRGNEDVNLSLFATQNDSLGISLFLELIDAEVCIDQNTRVIFNMSEGGSIALSPSSIPNCDGKAILLFSARQNVSALKQLSTKEIDNIQLSVSETTYNYYYPKSEQVNTILRCLVSLK